MMSMYRVLADLVVILHGGYVGFVVLGLVAILLGVVFRWRWVRNFWFRAVHLGAIGLVVGEALLGITCPLTTLEDRFRGLAGQTVQSGTFIGRWVHELIFFEGPPWVFTVSYCLFGAVVLAAFVFAPPRWPGAKKG